MKQPFPPEPDFGFKRNKTNFVGSWKDHNALPLFSLFLPLANPIRLSKYLSNRHPNRHWSWECASTGAGERMGERGRCPVWARVWLGWARASPSSFLPLLHGGEYSRPPQAGITVAGMASAAEATSRWATGTLSSAQAPATRTGSRMGQWACWPTTAARRPVSSPTSSWTTYGELPLVRADSSPYLLCVFLLCGYGGGK
jgi:hypothetical protein